MSRESENKKSRSDKLPAWHVYPGDWWKDNEVQTLDHHHKGIWFEMLLMMFESPERGVLLLQNGQQMTNSSLAKRLAVSQQDLESALTVLFDAGVPSRRSDGAIFSRRMVKDEQDRRNKIKAGLESAAQRKGQQTANSNPNRTPNREGANTEDEVEDINKKNNSLVLRGEFNTPKVLEAIKRLRVKLAQAGRNLDQLQLDAHCINFATPTRLIAAINYTCGLTTARNLIPAPEQAENPRQTEKQNSSRPPPKATPMPWEEPGFKPETRPVSELVAESLKSIERE